MFGDIIKVTPTSKVVGDMALFMVANDLTPEEVLDPDRAVAFPDSVVEFFQGDLGQPYGGFPEALQAKVLKGESPLTGGPGRRSGRWTSTPTRAEVEKKVRRRVTDRELAGYLMYPKVFVDFAEHQRTLRRRERAPARRSSSTASPRDDELFVDIETGKTLVVSFLTVGEADEEGRRTVFFELNGQPREVKVVDRSVAATGAVRRMADEGNPGHVAAPMPGLVVAVPAREGDVVAGHEPLTLEAMKMETGVFADRDGTVTEVLVTAGTQVDTKQLLMVIGEPGDGPEDPEEDAGQEPGDEPGEAEG